MPAEAALAEVYLSFAAACFAWMDDCLSLTFVVCNVRISRLSVKRFLLDARLTLDFEVSNLSLSVTSLAFRLATFRSRVATFFKAVSLPVFFAVAFAFVSAAFAEVKAALVSVAVACLRFVGRWQW